jgi:hypothetical protein
MNDDQQVEDLSFWKSFIEYFIKKKGLDNFLRRVDAPQKEKR